MLHFHSPFLHALDRFGDLFYKEIRQDEISALQILFDNDLTELPPGIFDSLTALTELCDAFSFSFFACPQSFGNSFYKEIGQDEKKKKKKKKRAFLSITERSLTSSDLIFNSLVYDSCE